MTPEENMPNMDELNNRRVERQLKRQADRAKKRRKKTMIMVLVAVLAVIFIVGLFFALRVDKEEEPEEWVGATTSGEEAPEGATVIHLVAAGDVRLPRWSRILAGFRRNAQLVPDPRFRGDDDNCSDLR